MVLLSVCAFLGIAVSAQRTGLRPTVFAIRDARVVTEPGKELAKATVVIRDGVIQAVGENVPPPVDALIIDGKGLVVYPGFIDAGSTWGIDHGLRRSETGPPEAVDYTSEALATTKADNRKGITPEFDVATALKVEEEPTDAWRKQGFATRLAIPEGGIVAGQSALVSLSGAAPRQAIIRTPVAMHAAFRVSGDGYPRTPMGIIAHFRQTLLDAGHHARLVEAYEKHGIGPRPPRDPALTALLPILEGKRRVIFEADSKDGIHRALDFCEEFKLQPVLFGGANAWKAADRIKACGMPVIVRLNFSDPAAGSEETRQHTPKRAEEDRQRRHKEEIRNAVVLQQKEILFAFSGHGLDKPEKFRENLRKVIAEGLSQEAALRALTVDAARILGVEKQLGTIAPGKAAHLVVMTGDFHEAKSQVRHLFSDGVHFEYDAAAPDKKPDDKDKKADDKKPDEKKKGEKKPDESAKTAEQATELEEDRKPRLRTGGDVLIKNATILTVTNGTIKADLLIHKGKITKIGPNLSVPGKIAMIDAQGMYVMPGIIDTHCHFSVDGGVNEATLSVVPEVRIRDVIDSEDVQIYRALAGGVTTCRLLHGSANCIGGQDAVVKLKHGEPAGKLLLAEAPRGVKFALGENVKRTGGRFPNTRLGVEAVLVRAFTEAQAYKQAWAQYEKGRTPAGSRPPLAVEPRRDLRLEALADMLDGKLHIHCHCYRADEILMLLRVADRFNIKIKSLQHVLEGYKIAPEIAAHGASSSTFSDWWAYKIEAYDAIPHNSALLHEAGALVCLKSDSSELMRHMYQEAAKLLKYGNMSETEALKTITLNGAKQLGLDQRIGSIEEGKDADLAIFNGHPLNGYSRCEMTLVEGEVYFQRSDKLTPFTPATAMPTNRVTAFKPIPPDAKGYLLRGVTVHPVSGPVQEGRSVLIEGNKIKDIVADTTKQLPGAARDMVESYFNEIAATKGIRIVDAKGLHLYPGMIDAGTVLGLTELGSARETQDFAEGGDFQPDLRALTGVNPDSELIAVTRANGVLTVVTRPMGGIIAGQSALINLHGWVPSEMAVVESLALHIEFPATLPMFTGDPILPMVGRAMARKQRDEKVRRVKELFKQALAYDEARRSAAVPAASTGGRDARAPVLDPRLEALIPYARGEKPVVIQANRKPDILEALKLGDELKLKMILSGGIDAWKVTDDLKKRNIPVILGPIMVMPQQPFDPYDAPFACAAKLHEAGIKFCIRSAGSTNTRNLPYEAAMAVSYGLPPEEGLKAVTLYPAEILGVADQLGSLEPGKIANLVLTDGDILQPGTQVHALFIKGVPLEPTSKHTRLYDRYRQRLKEVKEGKAPLGTK